MGFSLKKALGFALAVAAVATGVGLIAGAVTGGAVGIVAGAGATLGQAALSYAATTFLMTAGTTLALSALSPKPKAPTFDTGANASRGYETTRFGTAQPQQIIYGETKVAGVRVFDGTNGSDNKYLHRVVAIAGHPITSYEKIYLNDEEVTLDANGFVTSPSQYNGLVRIKKRLGYESAQVFSDLISEIPEWTNQHTLVDTAALYIRFEFDQDAFPNGIPEVTTVVKGKAVHDPRTNTNGYSNNPALCIRDFLINSKYGLGEVSNNIDDTSFSAAANACEASSSIYSGDKFTCNGAFLVGTEPQETIVQLLTSMAGTSWYAQGKWRIKAGVWTAPVEDFNEDDLRSGITVSTRHSRRDNFNVVRGTFRGESTNWQSTDYIPVKDTNAIEVDGQEVVQDYNLFFTTDHDRARHLARVLLEANRNQIVFTAKFGLKAFKVQVGDNVRITNEQMGFENKLFRVTNWTFGLENNLDLSVTMTLAETREEIFNFVDDGEIYERDNTNLPSRFDVPNVGISVNVIPKVINQKLSNFVEINVTSSQPERVREVAVTYRKTTESTIRQVGVGPLGRFEIPDLEDGTYFFTATPRNGLGVKGRSKTFTKNIQGLLDPPPAVTNFTSDVSGSNSIELSWDAVDDPTLSYYKIRYAYDTSPTNTSGWSNSTTIVEKVARPATSVVVPARAGTYLIKAYDKYDLSSTTATKIFVDENRVPNYTSFVLGDIEGTSYSGTYYGFNGTKTNTIVSNNELIIDSNSTAPATGEYIFNDYVTVYTNRQVRIKQQVQFTRLQESQALFDNLPPQNFDTLSGNFDDLTTFDEFEDVDVELWVSIATTNPSFPSTVWSDYEPVKSGIMYGWAFRPKLILKTKTPEVTPSVSFARITVHYQQ